MEAQWQTLAELQKDIGAPSTKKKVKNTTVPASKKHKTDWKDTLLGDKPGYCHGCGKACGGTCVGKLYTGHVDISGVAHTIIVFYKFTNQTTCVAVGTEFHSRNKVRKACLMNAWESGVDGNQDVGATAGG